MAGWLFADLALLLFIITVVVAADFPAEDTVAVAEEVAASPEPSPTLAPEPGVEPEPRVFYVDTDAPGIVSGESKAVDDLIDALDEDFAMLVDQGYKVGFALTFGGAADPGYGGDIAESANTALVKAFPDLFGDAPTRHFWTSSNKEGVDIGTLQIELYLLAV